MIFAERSPKNQYDRSFSPTILMEIPLPEPLMP